MDVRISEEQRAIADLAASIFAGDGETAPDWSVLADAGLPALLVPETDGGIGLGQLELTLVLIEQGRGLVAAPLWRRALAALALKDGAASATIALAGDAVATPSGAGWTVNGEALAVPGVDMSDRLVLAANVDGKARLFVVDLAGLERREGVLTDHDRACDLILREIPAMALELDGAWLHIRAAACVAALTAGVARGAIERTAAYVGARQQFGRPIGSFQAVAQRLADSFTDVEVTQTLAMELAWKIDAGADIGNTAEVASYWASQCAHRVAHAAMHLHGGMGADTSYPIHRVLLMSRRLELELGGARRQVARIGERLAA
jgi:alkylation response protein AidB-like acyl-CoA dehydrogenase